MWGYVLLYMLAYYNGMKLGGKYRFRDVTARHWKKLGEALGFRPDFVRRQVLAMNDKIVEAAAVLSGELNKNPETNSLIYERITSVINSDQAQRRNLKQHRYTDR